MMIESTRMGVGEELKHARDSDNSIRRRFVIEVVSNHWCGRLRLAKRAFPLGGQCAHSYLLVDSGLLLEPALAPPPPLPGHSAAQEVTLLAVVDQHS